MNTRSDENALYEENYAKIARFARNKVPESELHDLIHDCLTVLVDKRDAVENDEAFLFGVAKNKLKQYYQKRMRGLQFALPILDPEGMSFASLSTSLSIRVARRNDLEHAMSELPLRQYEAFQLRYIEGLKEADAARALGVAVATLKRDLGRARATLATVLGADSDESQLRAIVRGYVRQD